ncbi:hypothetical protein AX15_007068 [Amanita polypyramis BW_CC]|nr:hypothetical protein AX15_007068 [Amanita polypyramis BW_CC]
MGLLFSTMILTFLLSANYKALTICTIILLRSLEGLGGAFDVPEVKCPPNGGSSGCVTGSAASILSSSKKFVPASFSRSLCDPLFKSDVRRSQFDHFVFEHQFSQPVSSPSTSSRSGISTPPLTPDSCYRGHGSISSTSCGRVSRDALDFLMTLFPRHGLTALPYAKRMSISAPNLGAAFDGVVLDLPGEPRTLYADGKSAESVNLRERCGDLFLLLS